MPQIVRRRGTAARHHVGIPGDIISECPGDFIGIRSGVCMRQRFLSRTDTATGLDRYGRRNANFVRVAGMLAALDAGEIATAA
jgi:hypothetical protein